MQNTRGAAMADAGKGTEPAWLRADFRFGDIIPSGKIPYWRYLSKNGKCVVHTGTFTAPDAAFYVHKQREAICGKGLTMPMNWIFPATWDSKLMGGFPVHYMTCLVGRNSGKTAHIKTILISVGMEKSVIVDVDATATPWYFMMQVVRPLLRHFCDGLRVYQQVRNLITFKNQEKKIEKVYDDFSSCETVKDLVEEMKLESVYDVLFLDVLDLVKEQADMDAADVTGKGEDEGQAAGDAQGNEGQAAGDARDEAQQVDDSQDEVQKVDDAQDEGQAAGDAQRNEGQAAGDAQRNEGQAAGDAQGNEGQAAGDAQRNEGQAAGDARNEVQTAGDTRNEVQTAGDARDEVQAAGDTRNDVQTAGDARDEVQKVDEAKDEVQQVDDSQDEVQKVDDARDEVQVEAADDARNKGQASDNAEDKGKAAGSTDGSSDKNESQPTSQSSTSGKGKAPDSEPPTQKAKFDRQGREVGQWKVDSKTGQLGQYTEYPHLPGSRIGPGYSHNETKTQAAFDCAGMDKDEMSDLPTKMNEAQKLLESRRKYIPKHLTANPPAGYKYCPQCGVALPLGQRTCIVHFDGNHKWLRGCGALQKAARRKRDEEEKAEKMQGAPKRRR